MVMTSDNTGIRRVLSQSLALWPDTKLKVELS